MQGKRLPMLLSSGWREITATLNSDDTYRITASIMIKQDDGQEVDAVLEIERALIHIEAISNGGEVFKIVTPSEDPMNVDFPEPSKNDWKMLGFNESQARMLGAEG